jgi:D-alanyl-D-alanine carboxypeptidase/D-alanyl-D-alanine-endopeptidase (penicillin-binding protein 4)
MLRSSVPEQATKHLFVSLTVAVLVLLVVASAGADPSKRRLGRAIDRIVDRPELAHAFWGIEVRSLGSGKTLYERNADKAFRPASTLKLVTTAAALDAFGPDARFRTTVETAGRLDGLGRILGDVFLVGGGDPSLSGRFDDGPPTPAFETMVDALVAAGVRRIEGRLVGDEGAFSGERRGADWAWEDLTWGYGAEVSALAFNDNVVHLTLVPGERPGDPAVLDVVPRTALVPVVSTVTTTAAGTEEDLALDKPAGSNRVLLSGALPRGGSWEGDVAVEDPALFAATVFGEVLESRGIAVMGAVVTSSDPRPADARVLATHDGVPLARLIEEVNTESQNLHAEMLLRLLGRHASGEGSADKGHEAVAQFLERLEAPHAGWELRDGSGLSRTNILTPRGLAALLVAMDRHPHAAVFRASLAVAGVSGTLEERMRDTPAAGRVLAKTGTLRRVNALAGYVTTVRGERLAFAVLVNNQVELSGAAKDAIDAIAITLATAR